MRALTLPQLFIGNTLPGAKQVAAFGVLKK